MRWGGRVRAGAGAARLVLVCVERVEQRAAAQALLVHRAVALDVELACRVHERRAQVRRGRGGMVCAPLMYDACATPMAHVQHSW